MRDAMNITTDADSDTRWEDEPARPMWSSSGSIQQTPAQRAEVDRKRRIERDGNTILF